MDCKRRVIIADIHSKSENGKCTGHFFFFAENYKNVLDSDFEVVIAGGPVYKQRFSKEILISLPFDFVVGESKVINTLRSLYNSFCLFRKVKHGDIVIMQQARPVTSFVGIILFLWAKCRLFSVQYSKVPLKKRIYKTIFNLSKYKIDGILCPNEDVGKAYGIPYMVIPDYVFVEKMNNNTLIPYKDKLYDFCIVGRLNSDKGVAEMVKFFKNKKYKLLVAGNPDDKSYGEEIRALCDGADNITLRLGYLEDSEYISYIRESRYSILNYQNEYSTRSSGVVYDFVFNDVPIIGRECEAFNFVCCNNLGCVFRDFSSYDWEHLFDEAVYDEFLKNIRIYKQTHKHIIGNFKSFLKK